MKRTFSKLVESVERKKWKVCVAALCVAVLLLTLAVGCRDNQPMAPDGGGGDSPGVMTTTTAATTATINDEPLATTTTTVAETGETGDEMTAAATTTTANTSSLNKTETTTHGGSASATKTTAGKESAVVQEADFRTGISWDGKSPIIYTYKDGSMGTTPKDGATYEVLPGIVSTYYEPKDVESSEFCPDCGKIMGDGQDGTCVVWMMGAVDCPHCGERVEPHICHTCNE